jgi:oligosaccharide repeat unit polymerase
MRLSDIELICVLALGFLTLYHLLRKFMSRDYRELWSPMAFVSLIFFYYTVSGPLIAIDAGFTYFKLTEHRPFYEVSWIAALLSFVFFTIGYSVTQKPLLNSSLLVLREYNLTVPYGKWGLNLYIIGFLLFLVYAGSNIRAFLNPLGGVGVEELGYQGSFSNYFVLPVNFFVPALCLMLVDVLRKKFSLSLFLVLLFAAVSIYITFAFRYRLVMMGMALAVTHYSQRRTKPRLVFVVGILIVAITLMGVIQKTRTYFGGLNLNKIENETSFDFFRTGMGDAVTFSTMGLMIKNIPDKVDYIYFAPYVQGFLIPIPRALWPNKPAGEHLKDIYLLYGSEENGKGAAWPFYGEYYYSFGWFGIAIGSFLMGYVLKRFYMWFIRYPSPMVTVTYSTGLGILFFMITRGYFPQHVMLFFFAVYPCFFLIRRMKRLKMPRVNLSRA